MAKYRLEKPAWVEGRYIPADVRNPAYVEFPDDFVPSRTWEPVDKAAQKALLSLAQADREREQKLRDEKAGKLSELPAALPRPLVAVEAPPEAKKDEGTTMLDLTKMRGGKVVGEKQE